MRKTVKLWFYRTCRSVGLFTLARLLTARRLRILCYHGLSITDEHEYSPDLFMRTETVRARLRYLLQQGYPVLSLEQALKQRSEGTLPPNATVITFDDGFYGNYLRGTDLLREFALPMTLYVTTYYVVKQQPIFRHAVKYMFWKTQAAELDLEGLPNSEAGRLDLKNTYQTDQAMWGLIEYAESHLSERQRGELGRLLGQRLGVSYDELVQSRRLSLSTAEEIRELADLGMDIQLHTHRHHLPRDLEQTQQEIEENRAVLEPLLGRQCLHLCYPSGVYTPEQWPWLQDLGIQSATTCENGLNDATTPRYALRRFLDRENVQAIEFEAELCGFAELVRSLRGLFRKDRRSAGVSNLGAHSR
jgi:peptidoglycan/xylan/chitin deacetylase (PgdA/CDA1 family)